jgi:hypothetical protein
MKALSLTALLTGAAALALTASAAAQDNDNDSVEDGVTAEGRLINPDANAAAPAVGGAGSERAAAATTADSAAPVANPDLEGPEAAIVREETDQAGDPQPNEAAVAGVLDDAQPEAAQNNVAILPTETDEAQINPAHIWHGEDEAEGVTHLRNFMVMDADDDLLLTPAEWGAGGAAEADFAELDVNSSGQVGFAEYRVWLSLDEAEAAAGTGS